MRILDAKSSHWTIRHIYVIMALAGVAVLIGGHFISVYMMQISYEIFETLPEDDPNWLFYRDGGYGLALFFLSMLVGGGLVFLSSIVAIGYRLIRLGVKFESLKVKGSRSM